jgi:hypothetical protein
LNGAETSREFYGREKAVKLPVFNTSLPLGRHKREREKTRGMPA